MSSTGSASTTGERQSSGMSPERWLRVQEVFTAAIECSDAQREPLLARECGADDSLRREVEMLLDSHERAGPLDHLARQLNAPARWRDHVEAMEWSGRKVAQYSIVAPLGAGAMGWVYKARDERLNRTVALKFLPPHLSARGAAQERLLQEARAAAALDHPNICAILEIGTTADGQMFIAMPLYSGETLQARLERGRLPLGSVISIALQVANGLAHAHEHGVVHRDVKPSNIMLLPDGSVKVLDFGVARSTGVDQGVGAAAGTLAYMSPEQVRAERLDHRTDIWSLGVVIYEMALGRRPFAGDTARELKDAILTCDPPLPSQQNSALSIEIDELLGKALARSAEQRYSSMSALAAELAALAERERYASLAPSPVDDSASRTSLGERRRAAVLFSIVADYAALVEQHAPEALDRLMNNVRNAAVEIVRRHGGLVNHAYGDEIVSLFGVPTGHEDDDLRAVRAALELHARVRQLAVNNGEGQPLLTLQSGVHSDLLVAQRLSAGPRRFGVTGSAVQIAQRLAMIASRDDVLISPECLAVVKAFVHTAAAAPVVLTADAAALTPHRVMGETGLQTRLEAAVRRGLTTYTGRGAELEQLWRWFEQARRGAGQVALIIGEAGVGKSRLLYELNERIAARAGAAPNHVRVLQARWRSYGRGAPYHPFVEILHQCLQLQAAELRATSIDAVVERIRAIDRVLEQWVPLYLHLLSLPSARHPLPRDLHAEQLQQAMPEALASLIVAFARCSPLVLLFEDWHWSDDGSREALLRLTQAAARQAIFIVVTSRPESVEPPWHGRAHRLPLAPLDFESSLTVIRDVLHVERVAQPLARRLYERTGGNPFFLEEICHTLVEQGSIASRDGEGDAAGGVQALRLPDTVQAVIRARLDALDQDALEVLRVAAVIGRDFSHALLINVLADRAGVIRALDRLCVAGLIQSTNAGADVPLSDVVYRFKHVLTHEVTYESLLGHQRRTWHRVVGDALTRFAPEHLPEQAVLLAHHFTRAEAWDLAALHGRRAAERALALSQFADALALLDDVQSCIAHLPDDESRFELTVEVLLQQERLCETLGQRGRQQSIVGELIALLAPRGASAHLALTYQRQGDLLTLLKRFGAADRALSTALRISRDLDDAGLERHALRSIGLLRWHEGRHVEALAAAERAVAIDREQQDEQALAGDLANLGAILKSMGEHQRALQCFEEALALPALADNPSTVVYSLQHVANVHRLLGDVDGALAHLERADEIARVCRQPIKRSFHLMAIAHIHLQQGRVAESIETYQEAIELSRRSRHADGLVQSLRALGEVLLGLGRDVEALPYLKEAAALFAQLEDRAGEMEMRTHVARILEKRATPAEAAEAWRATQALCVQLRDAQGELAALEGIARTTRRIAGPDETSVKAVTEALTLATTLSAKPRELALRNSLGILRWERGEYELALRQYESALVLAQELGERVHEGLILNSLGVTLSRLNRLEEARTVLEESRTLNRHTGQRLLEAHALAALGEVCQVRLRHAEARECFERALELRQAIGDAAGAEHMQRRLAQAAAAAGAN